MFRILLTSLLSFTLLTTLVGCGDAESEADVVVYTSVDEPTARPIIEGFEDQTGLNVWLVTDTEASKSVGLTERLRAEADRPQADIWWGNDPFYTAGLAEDGLLEPYVSPSAQDIPAQYKDPQNRWTGNALRARVIAAAPDARIPVDGLEDLLNEELRGQVVLARPTAGTTGGHVAALYEVWGQEKADAFFRGLYENDATLVAGNSQSAQHTAAGNFSYGLTDNDDVANLRASGQGLGLILPDQGEDDIGTLTIPTTVGLVANRPDNPAARQLVDYLLSAETEKALLDMGFGAYSVRATEGDQAVKPMAVDYATVAESLPQAIQRATALLVGRQPE